MTPGQRRFYDGRQPGRFPGAVFFFVLVAFVFWAGISPEGKADSLSDSGYIVYKTKKGTCCKVEGNDSGKDGEVSSCRNLPERYQVRYVESIRCRTYQVEEGY